MVPTIHVTLSKLLSKFKIFVTSVYTGEEAITIFDGVIVTYHPFEFLIFDLTISQGMGGKDTAQEILRRFPDTRIIASHSQTSKLEARLK